MTSAADPDFYFAESTMAADIDCYITRPADSELRKALLAQKFTVILSSRKVGKSSLIERVFDRVHEEDGILVAKHELTSADSSITAEGWYSGLINSLVQDAKLRNGFQVAAGWWEWWKEHSLIPPGERLKDFLRLFFLEPTDKPWVIAIDEIDTTIPLSFSDDFFAAIRGMLNSRGPKSPFQRLTFLLVGVATPSQLIKDPRRTPFNVGHYIQLTDFTAAEAQVLLRGLGEVPSADHPALLRVLHWTGGHPYLTQRIFFLLADLIEAGEALGRDWPVLVDAVVKTSFLRLDSRTTEPHLEDIARRRIGLLDATSNPRPEPALKRAMLTSWREALREGWIRDDALARHLSDLKLCGLLVPDPKRPTCLIPRNRIYEEAFNADWVAEEIPKDEARKYRRYALTAFLAAFIATYGWIYNQRSSEANRITDLKQQIQRADSDVPETAFAELKAIPGQETEAQTLLAEYWKKKARVASVERPRDEAAVFWLKAQTVQQDQESLLQGWRVLSGSLPQVAMTFRYEDSVLRAEFSPDGNRVLMSSKDNTARIWDAQTGQLIGKPLKHDVEISQISFSPDDGRRVVTASGNAARIWDARTSQPICEALLHVDTINHVSFSPDGRRVVTASKDSTAGIWDANTGRLIGKLLQHRNIVSHAEFSPDGTQIVTASGTIGLFSTDQSGQAQIWDVTTGQPLGVSFQHENALSHAEFSPDGSRVLTSSWDKTARIWDAVTGSPIGAPLQHGAVVSYAEFSSDGRLVLTTSWDETARVWDAETGQQIGKNLPHDLIASPARFSSDGGAVLTVFRNTAYIWGAQTSQVLGIPLQHETDVSYASFSTDSRRVATISSDKKARIWNVRTGQPIGKELKFEGNVGRASFSPDGNRVVSRRDNKSAQIWDVQNSKPLAKPFHHEGWITSASFSPNGTRVVTASEDKTARIWDSQTGQPVGKELRHEDRVNHASFSQDGRRVVTASKDKTARIWDAQTGEMLVKPLQHASIISPTEDSVEHASFSPDGTLVVTVSFDASALTYFAHIWNAQTGQSLGKPLQQASIMYAEFSPDSRRVTTASLDNTARIWDAQSSQLIGHPLKHGQGVKYASFTDFGFLTQTDQTLTKWHRLLGFDDHLPLVTIWADGGSWLSEPLTLPDGSIRILDRSTGDTAIIRDIKPGEPEEGMDTTTPVDPEKMLEDYMRRFSLKFAEDAQGRIKPALVPRHSTK